MQISFIDHYDSFSFNVIDWLQSAEASLHVERIFYDDQSAMLDLIERPRPVVLSPGPKSPDDAVATLEVVKALWGKAPILGICLGHQILAVLAGAEVKPLENPIHGLTKLVCLDTSCAIFRDMPETCELAAYNSLSVVPESIGAGSKIIAKTRDGEIQAIQYENDFPVLGFQFHPESFLSGDRHRLAKNWLNLLDPN